jgi:hypothetical protein
MKKIVFALAVLMLASPAWATVYIYCEQIPDTCDVLVSYDARTEDPNLVRAFALDVSISIGTIEDVNCISTDYYIYPGSISIDSQGNVLDDGHCWCNPGDHPDTLGGLGTGGVTIEMGSLYDDDDPVHTTPPDPCGVLFSFTAADCELATVTIVGNDVRGKVVMEDGSSRDPCSPGCEVECAIPTCWWPTECGGLSVGDATCNGSVDLADLFALKAAWGKTAPYTSPFCCADFNQSGGVDLADLFALKGGWGTTGLTPATGNQACP